MKTTDTTCVSDELCRFKEEEGEGQIVSSGDSCIKRVYWYRCFVVSLRVVAENVVTDERTDTHTHETSTVTLAAHARRRGLISTYQHTRARAHTQHITFLA